VGHRRRLLDAIKALAAVDDAPTAAAPKIETGAERRDVLRSRRFDGYVAKYMGDRVLVISATREHMRTAPSGRCGPGWRSSSASDDWRAAPARWQAGSASPPGSSWWRS